ANEIIEITTQEYGEEMSLNEVFPQNIHNVEQMISLRNFVYNVVNIARNCKIIAEVTLNRFVRTPSKLITMEKV
ncbi:MAG: hypothetical protein QXS50_07335, partial [Candidatus Caldarchaeum sp.]